MDEIAREPEFPLSSQVSASVFAAVLGIVAIAGQPCALFPRWINFEAPAIRWAGLGVGIIAAAGFCTVARLRLTNTAATKAYIGAGFCAILGVGFRFMPPGMNGNGFAFALPAMLILIPFSLGILLYCNWALPKVWLWCFLGFAGWATLRIIPQFMRADEILPFAAYALVPLAVAIVYRRGLLSNTWTIVVACAIWGFSCLHAIQQILVLHTAPSGISGNPNWLSATMIGIAPWVAMGAVQLADGIGAKGKPAKLAAAALPLAVTAWILYRCHTRALYLSLSITAILAVFYWIKKPIRRIIFLVATGATIAVAVTLVSLYYFDSVRTAYNQDVRAPLWFSCSRLIAQEPLIGHRAGEPEQRLPDLLVDSDYHKRRVAAEWMEHPHNQLLYIAIYLGIPAAIVWLMLLIPVLGNPFDRPLPIRLAQFAAVNMLILGMADKALIKAPSNIWWLVMLGICWSPRIESTGKEPLRKQRPLIWLSACWAAVMASMFIFWFAVADGLYGWNARRGDQLLGAGYAEQAHAYYEKALEHRPERLPTAYKAATVALQQIHPMRRELVYDSLQRVYSRCRNFAHINRLWGRYCGEIGSHDRALQFFERDVELFPENIISRQWYLHELIPAGVPSRLADAEAAVNRAYVSRINAYAEFTHDEGLPYRWLNAFEEGKWDEAAQQASAMTSAIRAHDYIDPLVPWGKQERWPAFYLGSQFTPHDAAYLQSVALRETLWENEWKKSKDPLAIVWWVFKNFEFDTTRADWAWPHELYQTRKGSIKSGVTFLCFMLREHHLVYQSKNPRATFILMPIADRLAKISPRKKTVDFIPKNERKMMIPPIHTKNMAIMVLPPEFLTRTQVLEAMRQEYRSFRNYLNFARLPTIRVEETNRRFAEFGLKVSAPGSCWSYAVEGFRQRLVPPDSKK